MRVLAFTISAAPFVIIETASNCPLLSSVFAVGRIRVGVSRPWLIAEPWIYFVPIELATIIVRVILHFTNRGKFFLRIMAVCIMGDDSFEICVQIPMSCCQNLPTQADLLQPQQGKRTLCEPDLCGI